MWKCFQAYLFITGVQITAGMEDNVLEKAFVFNEAKNQYIHFTQLNTDRIPRDASQNYSQITVKNPLSWWFSVVIQIHW